MKLKLSTFLSCDPKIAYEWVQTPSLLRHIAAPLVEFTPLQPTRFPQRWTVGDYLVDMRLFSFLPFGKQTIAIRVDPNRQLENQYYELLDDGHSALIARWRHLIRLEGRDGSTLYTDELEIQAGLLTPLIWLFALAFYSHRQRRWRTLVEAKFAPLHHQEA